MKAYLDVVWRQSICYHEMRLILLPQDRRSEWEWEKEILWGKKKVRGKEYHRNADLLWVKTTAVPEDNRQSCSDADQHTLLFSTVSCPFKNCAQEDARIH